MSGKVWKSLSFVSTTEMTQSVEGFNNVWIAIVELFRSVLDSTSIECDGCENEV